MSILQHISKLIGQLVGACYDRDEARKYYHSEAQISGKCHVEIQVRPSGRLMSTLQVKPVG